VIPAVGVAMVLLFEAGVHETARGAPVLCGPLALVQQGQAAVKLRRAMGGALYQPARCLWPTADSADCGAAPVLWGGLSGGGKIE